MTTIYKYRVYCQTESVFRYWFLDSNEIAPTTCPNDSGHSIDQNQTVIIDTTSSVVGRTAQSVNNFDEVVTSTKHPIVQNTFTGNILNDQLYRTRLSNGASIGINNNKLTASLSTTVGSTALIQSRKVLKYLPGYSIYVSGACKFDTPVSGSRQLFGVYSETDDIMIGYEGTDFVCRFSTSGKVQIVEFTITQEANNSQTATITLNDIDYTVSLTDADGLDTFTAYQIEIGNTYDDLWIVKQSDNKISFVATDSEVRGGAYAFSSTGNATATVSTIETGQPRTTTTVTQSNFNGNTTLTLDPLKHNMYEIEYSWYGSGNFTFKVYNPFTASYEKLHEFYFSNQQTEPSLSNPNMYITFLVQSVSSTSIIETTFIGSFAGSSGKFTSAIAPQRSFSASKTIRSGVEKNIFSIRPRNYINNMYIKAPILIQRFFFSNESTRTCIVKGYYNPTSVGNNDTEDYTNYSFVDENQSFALVDQTSISSQGGILLFTQAVKAQSSEELSFCENPIFLEQGNVFLLTAELLSGNNSEIDASIIYTDYF